MMKRWTRTEIDLLKTLRLAGKSWVDIGKKLGRGWNSVRFKFKRLTVRKPVKNINVKRDISKERTGYKFTDPASLERVIVITDLHYPHHIPLRPFMNFVKEFKPTKFIYGGDMFDGGVISHHESGQFKHIGYDHIREQFHNELQGFNELLDRFGAIVPNAEHIYIVGNHEAWFDRFHEENPQIGIKDGFAFRGFAKLDERKMTVIPYDGRDRSKGYYNLGKVSFCHGHQFGSQNPAKMAVLNNFRTTFFGHHHVYKVWPAFGWIHGNDKKLGVALPCYSNVRPYYGKGRPNAWLNGFLWLHMKKSGKFSFGVQLVSPDGHFMDQYGKEWV